MILSIMCKQNEVWQINTWCFKEGCKMSQIVWKKVIRNKNNFSLLTLISSYLPDLQ